MKSKIIVLVGFTMFALGIYFSDKSNVMIGIGILGASIMWYPVIRSIMKKLNE